MQKITSYDFVAIQDNIRKYWEEKSIYKIAKQNVADKKKYYFLDGPPYTSGKVHIGTAWNKALKDMVLRYKRMQGFDVWDRAGYDMHGLPTEHATEKELGIQGSEAIQEYGVKKFIDACRELCIRNMKIMNKDFSDLGVWMDFENAYQTVSKEWMEAEWWFIKTAHEKGRIYEGFRTTTWDVPNATAVAKHELEYKEIEDTAIFVKFPLVGKENEFLVIWTTTPWTIPFNLAVMVNPDLEYVLAKNKSTDESWWLVKELADNLMKHIQVEYEITKTIKGTELEGWEYTHPLANDIPYAELKKDHAKVHTILLSKEYVDTSVGSGLVHCAPGCGPEDFEVGYKNGLPAFNTVNEQGVFEKAGQFNGLVAKRDDEKFITALENNGSLIFKHSYVHDYPHDWRSHEPVIFRTTKQWFIKVDDIREQLIRENDGITWQPKAAYNAFNSWLENIRDNSISKQRFWGTPLPIWRNTEDPEDYIVVGSAKELERLSGTLLEDLHIPSVDPVEFTKDGKTYKRVPDVLDVWVDAGTATWACKNFPHNNDETEFVADFILEGKDQIRGWFNLLHIMSNVAFGKKSFKNCYMHGFINDSQGRKMSKSEKNFITPEEVTEKYGVDVLRYYFIGAANPGYDMNYNFDDIELRSRNMNVLWNIHKFILDMQITNGFTQVDFEAGKNNLGMEEKYLLSKVNSLIKNTTELMENYKLNEVPHKIEHFFLEDLSRTYIQLVRDKTSMGSKEDKQAVYFALAHTYNEVLKQFAILVPYTSEQLYYNLKATGLELFSKDSVHFEGWPIADESFIDEKLEQDLAVAQKVITAALAAREKAKIGVRWPLASITLDVTPELKTQIEPQTNLITSQLNVKKIKFDVVPVKYEVKPDYRAIGKVFGTETGDVLTALKGQEEIIAKKLEKGQEKITIGSFEFTPDLFNLTILPQEDIIGLLFDLGKVSLDTEMTPELESEGFAREITRKIQNLRKKAGLEKNDVIVLAIETEDLADVIKTHNEAIGTKVGAEKFELNTDSVYEHTSEEKVKGKTFTISLQKL